MDDIDVSLLRSFVAVAETGRMTTAAKVVNRSQGRRQSTDQAAGGSLPHAAFRAECRCGAADA